VDKKRIETLRVARTLVKRFVNTNTVESKFSFLKRGLIGTSHSVSKKHLPLCLAEFDHRYNDRIVTDGPCAFPPQAGKARREKTKVKRVRRKMTKVEPAKLLLSRVNSRWLERINAGLVTVKCGQICSCSREQSAVLPMSIRGGGTPKFQTSGIRKVLGLREVQTVRNRVMDKLFGFR
jgi:hypothetical protein